MDRYLRFLLVVASAAAATFGGGGAAQPLAPAPSPNAIDLNKTLYPWDQAALDFLGVKYNADDPCLSPDGSIVCDASSGPHRVIALSLVNCSAGGTLSTAAMRNLSGLQKLSLENCPLSPESVPPEFGGSLTSLFSLSSLGRNLQSPGLMKLSASWLANLTSLVDLFVSDVEIDSGSDGLFRITQKLQRLQTMDIMRTKIGGALPRNTWPISVVHLDISDNGISGGIPSEISKFTSIVHLDMSGNSLSGRIPSDLSLLSALQHLDLSENAEISGAIPASFGASLSELRYLDLSGNNLTGSIPSSFSSLVKLYHLDLASNNLTGNIPSGIASMANLSYVDLSNNGLNGTIPANISLLSNLTYLDLSSNSLSGVVPFDDAFLAQLTELRLSDNPGLCHNHSAVNSKLLQGVAKCEAENGGILAPAPAPSAGTPPPPVSGGSRLLSKPASIAVAAAAIAICAGLLCICVVCCCRRRRRNKRRN